MDSLNRRQVLQTSVLTGLTAAARTADAQFSWMKPAPETPKGPSHIPFASDNPAIQYFPMNCERCTECVFVCRDVQTVFDHEGHFPANTVPCIHCGQCTVNCVNNGVTERFQLQEIYNEIQANKKTNGPKKFVALTAPSVRSSLGEMFKMERGTNVEKQMITGLRKLGFDYVFDVTFGADLTAFEESIELENHLKNEPGKPMFTSCCPAWLRFAELFFPEVQPLISSCKSPIRMLASVVKTWYADQLKMKPEDLVVVSFSPCTAKKYERTLGSEVDFALTVRELGWWLMEIGLKLDQLEPGEFDSVLGNGTGGGVIFGNTGGVTEGVLRQLHFTWTGKEPPKDWLLFTPVRGIDAIRRAEVKIGEKTLRVAIVHGAGNIRRLLETKEHLKFDFVEVMACPGGCIGGGGQPKTELPVTDALRTKRMSGLFSADKAREKHRCGENPALVALYENFLKEPGNPILHTR